MKHKTVICILLSSSLLFAPYKTSSDEPATVISITIGLIALGLTVYYGEKDQSEVKVIKVYVSESRVNYKSDRRAAGRIAQGKEVYVPLAQTNVEGDLINGTVEGTKTIHVPEGNPKILDLLPYVSLNEEITFRVETNGLKLAAEIDNRGSLYGGLGRDKRSRYPEVESLRYEIHRKMNARFKRNPEYQGEPKLILSISVESLELSTTEYARTDAESGWGFSLTSPELGELFSTGAIVKEGGNLSVSGDGLRYFSVAGSGQAEAKDWKTIEIPVADDREEFSLEMDLVTLASAVDLAAGANQDSCATHPDTKLCCRIINPYDAACSDVPNPSFIPVVLPGSDPQKCNQRSECTYHAGVCMCGGEWDRTNPVGDGRTN